MIAETLISVPTGKKSLYVFKKAGNAVCIYTTTNDNEIEHPYHDFYGEKPTTAIMRLMERAAELEKFFKLVQKHSIFHYGTLRLDQMPSDDLIDMSDHEDAAEDWEFMSQLLEAAEREDTKDEPTGTRWSRDEEDD